MVGQTGRRQAITLASGCWTNGIVAHEIGELDSFFKSALLRTAHFEKVILNSSSLSIIFLRNLPHSKPALTLLSILFNL